MKPKKKKQPHAVELRRLAALYNLGNHASFPSTVKPGKGGKSRPAKENEYEAKESPEAHTANKWKLGHNNSTSSFKLSASGIDGLLEPSDGARQVLAMHASPCLEFEKLLLAYPPPSVTSVSKTLAKPAQNWTKPYKSQPTTSQYNTDMPGAWEQERIDSCTKPPWNPPGSVQTNDKSPPKTQRKEKHQAKEYTIPNQTVERMVRQAQKAERGYMAVKTKNEKEKNPAQTYALPIAASPAARSYRLGLEPLPSSNGQEIKKPRPKSAIHLSTAIKVAGAKMRPKTAKMTFLRSATVCYMDTPETNTVEEYASKLQAERERRKNISTRKHALHRIARYESIRERSVEYMFNFLRNQALDNVPRHLHTKYEELDMDEYMRLVETNDDENPFWHADDPSHTYDSAWDGCVLGLLWVDRLQFSKAMQCLKMSLTDVNLLFSAFDFHVDHRVEVS
ncbi:hypothetical protein Ae201684_014855 [Aphanomyces euteiches]|uniref:Uncharacterized protein n=1 Tax=Aphanomyces euteiches TaxID=100861 RepID=A0A6G0WIH4_9STRA|nr:hypothetical protein Ae201684_014855 [Aphanomyces euteiches]KAH9151714.1 hypothetical protein AeRB84_005728 [Aphanomyces euteiches]